MIIALAGRRIDAPGTAPPGFPLANVSLVRARVADELRGARALVCAAACGADLVAIECAAALGVRRRIVLPGDRASFRAHSVIDRPGDWGQLYDRVTEAARRGGDLVEFTPLSAGDEAYLEANEKILDEAARLGDVTAVVVWAGRREGLDVTAGFAESAAMRGFPVHQIRSDR